MQIQSSEDRKIEKCNKTRNFTNHKSIIAKSKNATANTKSLRSSTLRLFLIHQIVAHTFLYSMAFLAANSSLPQLFSLAPVILP